ncbi:hypothetical protein DDB_G0290969 [Dictyostelium discoideum AX4]|uniref:DNA2/NAM7 helicase helicase domain-containing protein n=1 Tax=Dictyostelium discoideum TaxID=44689 RepID=Q54FC2_DICDI|nr:hypothetical protein DDB_G0290969 [Dictyostelium discoideum AX4]EAL61915.1 hypothetical protein DDB_G0290969 [Dictyostelium discoideum AX4]|eukprot:XP_635415.1 hypothetical protein DDB_G0290969 [Dictyostelium discoideum AX4]
MKNEQSIDGEKGDQIINSQMIINNVLIDGRSTGLLGRVFLKFVMENGGDLQFENDCEFQIGDSVGVRFQSSKPNKMINYQLFGEIYKIKSNKIIISIDCDDPTLFSSFGQPYKWVQEDYSFIKFSIDKINFNENQNKILKETLESLNGVNGYEKYKSLFEDDNNNDNICTTKDQFKNSEIILKDLENNIINNNQDIIKINNSNNTCKVKTITDIIKHLIKSNDKNKILVYSSSNESIDFICNSLYDDKNNNNNNNELITKIGSPSEIKNISLEYKIKHSEGGKSIKQIKQDIIELANNTLDSKKSDINSSISKITSLKKDLNKLEKSLINKTINESRIILSSSNINSLDKFLKDKNDFDWVIIDESNLILDKTCLVPILKGKKLIVISDYHN